MTDLHGVLAEYVRDGSVPGAVGLVAGGDRVEVAAAGHADLDGTRPMARDSIFRIASATKPIIAAAVMILIEDGRIALDEPVGHWLPELSAPAVVRTPGAPLDDMVPAARPITVFDLLTFRSGYGFPSDFSLPAVQPLFSELKQGPPQPQLVAAPQEWMAALSRIPLLYQPGEAWLYNTCSDIQGVLIARVADRPLPEFLAERLLEPLGMVDTGFFVPAGKLDRFTSYYRTDPAGGLQLVDAPNGQWSSPPAFPSGAGGLVSTVDDWYRFARMLLAEGTVDGRRLLSPGSVRQMTTDQLTNPGPARCQPAVPGGPGLGLRRLGRRGDHRRLEPARSLRLDRRYRNRSAPDRIHRYRHHPAQPGPNGRTDRTRTDAGLLAVRGARVKCRLPPLPHRRS